MTASNRGLKQYAQRVRRPYPQLYHISFRDDLAGVWQPRAPAGDYNEDDDETLHGEPTTPRISLAPTIEQAFQAVYANVKHLFEQYPHLTFHVYQAVFRGTEQIVTPEQFSKHRLVHDAHITQEYSVLSPLKMTLTSRVKIHKPHDSNRVHYYAFDIKDKEYYGWLPGDIDVERLSVESHVAAWLEW